MAKCAAARDFFAGQGDLTTPYFVYCKENQRGTAEKDPSLGRFDIFKHGLNGQIKPSESAVKHPCFGRKKLQQNQFHKRSNERRRPLSLRLGGGAYAVDLDILYRGCRRRCRRGRAVLCSGPVCGMMEKFFSNGGRALLSAGKERIL